VDRLERAGLRRSPEGGRVVAAAKLAAIFIVPLFLVAGLLFGIRLAFGAIGDAVCADYNSFSNDFCDEWHYDSPPDDALPVPDQWGIRWQKLDCGSGGCGNRLYVLEPLTVTDDAVTLYLDEIRSLGWRSGAGSTDARKDDLAINVERASDRVGVLLVPKRLGRPEYVYVALAICGGGTICD
jgi:hypothetical protein